jgi:uncharacterized protein YcnI
MTIRNLIAATTALLSLAPATQAHVSIWPRDSRIAATERYLVRIPTEGKVATVGAELDVPAGVVVETLMVPNGWKHSVKREGDRIVGIVWEVNVPPGEYLEVGFVARNPREGSEIVWTLRQKFADGTVSDWTKSARGTFPTAITKLAPRAQ